MTVIVILIIGDITIVGFNRNALGNVVGGHILCSDDVIIGKDKVHMIQPGGMRHSSLTKSQRDLDCVNAVAP